MTLTYKCAKDMKRNHTRRHGKSHVLGCISISTVCSTTPLSVMLTIEIFETLRGKLVRLFSRLSFRWVQIYEIRRCLYNALNNVSRFKLSIASGFFVITDKKRFEILKL